MHNYGPFEGGVHNKMKLWLDKWHSDGVLIKTFGERIRCDAGSDRLSLASSIICNGSWNPGPATSHQLMQTWGQLEAIKRLPIDLEDITVWTATSNGHFSTKSAWNVIRNAAEKVDWLMLYGIQMISLAIAL